MEEKKRTERNTKQQTQNNINKQLHEIHIHQLSLPKVKKDWNKDENTDQDKTQHENKVKDKAQHENKDQNKI